MIYLLRYLLQFHSFYVILHLPFAALRFAFAAPFGWLRLRLPRLPVATRCHARTRYVTLRILRYVALRYVAATARTLPRLPLRCVGCRLPLHMPVAVVTLVATYITFTFAVTTARAVGWLPLRLRLIRFARCVASSACTGSGCTAGCRAVDSWLPRVAPRFTLLPVIYVRLRCGLRWLITLDLRCWCRFGRAVVEYIFALRARCVHRSFTTTRCHATIVASFATLPPRCRSAIGAVPFAHVAVACVAVAPATFCIVTHRARPPLPLRLQLPLYRDSCQLFLYIASLPRTVYVHARTLLPPLPHLRILDYVTLRYRCPLIYGYCPLQIPRCYDSPHIAIWLPRYVAPLPRVDFTLPAPFDYVTLFYRTLDCGCPLRCYVAVVAPLR